MPVAIGINRASPLCDLGLEFCGFFGLIARTFGDFATLYSRDRNLRSIMESNTFEVTQMMHSRPSFIRLPLAELSSGAFAQRANERSGYAPASENNKRL